MGIREQLLNKQKPEVYFTCCVSIVSQVHITSQYVVCAGKNYKNVLNTAKGNILEQIENTRAFSKRIK